MTLGQWVGDECEGFWCVKLWGVDVRLRVRGKKGAEESREGIFGVFEWGALFYVSWLSLSTENSYDSFIQQFQNTWPIFAKKNVKGGQVVLVTYTDDSWTNSKVIFLSNFINFWTNCLNSLKFCRNLLH